ncbi:hypothetical protein [Paenibacillus cremeus]|uniref:hypothetical protein n=1 Tax=Paenibacillus cremeus TaxID=2163881 RepID=UPI0021BDA30F|nr:hypothetical protein [Paenibacillus cremeus]
MNSNQRQNSIQPLPDINLLEADQAGLSAMKLFAGLSDLIVDVRDEFYVDEFALNKFSYRTLGLEKDGAGAPKESKELPLPAQHKLKNQEVEYMLYGSHSCAGNYSMAYAELFAVRLAVGITEALAKPSNEVLAAGSPMLVLLKAVVEGAIAAQQDVTKLIQGEQVPITKGFASSLTLSYKDYLRLFLLLHSKESVLLSRMQALLQLNTGIQLSEASTYTVGTASASLHLWFLPNVMKTLEARGFSGCEGGVGAGNNICKMTRTAHLRY